jgi:ribulose-5-phosphate 4-epimerase/fuculose-1-phosphate aldolase
MPSDATLTEGTIRFSYTLRAPAPGERMPRSLCGAAESWCAILRALGLLGRDAARYEGYAFGNVSVRDSARIAGKPAPTGARFFVTASQTTDRPCAAPEAWTRIDACDLARFSVHATGDAPPSSETLTHAAIYAADAAIGWIFHVHAPAIWRACTTLALATIGADVPYGSPALATAVERLAWSQRARPLLFATLGHEDGVFACGADADGTASALVALLARASR